MTVFLYILTRFPFLLHIEATSLVTYLWLGLPNLAVLLLLLIGYSPVVFF